MKLKEALEMEQLHEMSNALPKETGLPCKIWIQEIPGMGKKLPHQLPRMKFLHDHEQVSISIAYEPKILISNTKIPIRLYNKLKRWINLNYEDLLLHWNQKISSKEFLDNMKRLDSGKKEFNDARDKR
jgi:hypothetical protein